MLGELPEGDGMNMRRCQPSESRVTAERATPLLIDLFCGLGGWSRAFLAQGWDAIGFDIERHDYGSAGYPGQLVLQDVCTLEGRQIADADCIVASSPCQEFSYRAMPWKQARALSPDEAGQPEPAWWEKTEEQMSEGEMAEWIEWRERFPKPPPILGIKLFWQAFRLQREIFEATGRHVPLVAENVRGAQRWVSPAKANFGSFFLWGDIFQHGNRIYCGDRPRIGMEYLIAPSGVGGKANPGQNNQDGRKQEGSGPIWFDRGIAALPSRSPARKAASAVIAMIPYPLAEYVARACKTMEAVGVNQQAIIRA